MSYNLLLDTNFNNIDKHWKLSNCIYKNGYLISNGDSKIYSIEQEIVLPDPTKLYFCADYICLDKNIKHVYCGIFTEGNILNAIKKRPTLRKRNKLSVVTSSNTEKIKVAFIIEAKTPNTKIYIDSPLLIDLNYHGKNEWPKWILNNYLKYRCGYNYKNLYPTSEIKIDNEDFKSPYTKIERGKIGILATVEDNDWFKISHKFIADRRYLVKLDYKQINEYGQLYLKYGETISEDIKEEQLYITFKANNDDVLKLHLENKEELPYLLNLKHIMIIDITNLKIDEDDILHLPFI